MEPVRVTQHPEANEQILYYSTTSLTADDNHIVFISDRTGDPNLFARNLETGEETRLTDNEDGNLKSYLYLDGNFDKGFGKASPCLHAQSGTVFYIQGRTIRSANLLNGKKRILAEFPEGQISGFTHVSEDGIRLCVPTMDARIYDGDHILPDGRPGYDVCSRVRDLTLNSQFKIYETHTGEIVLGEFVPNAWITHVQFCPINADIVLYNHERNIDKGTKRLWIWNIRNHRQLRTAFDDRDREDDARDQTWGCGGYAVIYHGQYKNGRQYIGRVWVPSKEITEIPLPEEWNRYGHFSSSAGSLLVSDGYYQQDDDQAEHYCGSWISIVEVDWEKRTVEWHPLCRHGSSWKSADSHPHPIFNHSGDKIYFNSDRDGKVAVYSVDVPEHLRPKAQKAEE